MFNYHYIDVLNSDKFVEAITPSCPYNTPLVHEETPLGTTPPKKIKGFKFPKFLNHIQTNIMWNEHL